MRENSFDGGHTSPPQSAKPENALEESEERLRSAMDVAQLALWDWDIATGRVHWSDEHFRQQGYAVGEVTPSYEAWLKRIHPDDVAEAEARVARARDAREDYRHEFRVVHPDGSIRWLSARGRFFHDPDGRPVRMIGAVMDVTERREWQERQAVLVDELQHRTLNLMAVVRALAERSFKGIRNLAEFRESFLNRIDALARAQALLSRRKESGPVTFDALLEGELLSVGANAARVALKGPKGVALRSSSVQVLAMAIHELARNALEHGAIGQPAGHLGVGWEVHREADKAWLKIDWRETGVPVASEHPLRPGQGLELVQRALPYQLGARVTHAMEADGLRCTIDLPLFDRRKK